MFGERFFGFCGRNWKVTFRSRRDSKKWVILLEPDRTDRVARRVAFGWRGYGNLGLGLIGGDLGEGEEASNQP